MVKIVYEQQKIEQLHMMMKNSLVKARTLSRANYGL